MADLILAIILAHDDRIGSAGMASHGIRQNGHRLRVRLIAPVVCRLTPWTCRLCGQFRYQCGVALSCFFAGFLISQPPLHLSVYLSAGRSISGYKLITSASQT
ncbi:MAG: hypothetical protein PF501_13085 [Salinisphaera sp.]|nr:hypothetical protein [Salinisphaera sp.]